MSAAIQALVPHAGAMCLWQEVIDWDAGQLWLRADNHRRDDHPLRRQGLLSAVHLCEYGAQAMAVHGGLLARAQGQAPRAGLLVSLRGVRLQVARLDTLEGPLEGHAQLLQADAHSQQYAFAIHHRGQRLAEGRVAAMLQPEDPA